MDVVAGAGDAQSAKAGSSAGGQSFIEQWRQLGKKLAFWQRLERRIGWRSKHAALGRRRL